MKKKQTDTAIPQPADDKQEELLPLMMPDSPFDDATVSTDKDTEEEEELDDATARRRLMESFVDNDGEKSDFNLSFVLRGDILTTKWLRRHILWLIMVVFLTFLYVSNRYSAQKQMIHINSLKEQLKETHYDAMARSSELMRNCRRSTIINKIENDPLNTLETPKKQPVVIYEE